MRLTSVVSSCIKNLELAFYFISQFCLKMNLNGNNITQYDLTFDMGGQTHIKIALTCIYLIQPDTFFLQFCKNVRIIIHTATEKTEIYVFK